MLEPQKGQIHSAHGRTTNAARDDHGGNAKPI